MIGVCRRTSLAMAASASSYAVLKGVLHEKRVYPSLISLMVSVDVKHHVYLFTKKKKKRKREIKRREVS